MPPKTEYAMLGYAVALVNGYSFKHIIHVYDLSHSFGAIMLAVMGVTLMSWFYMMSRFGLYEESG